MKSEIIGWVFDSRDWLIGPVFRKSLMGKLRSLKMLSLIFRTNSEFYLMIGSNLETAVQVS